MLTSLLVLGCRPPAVVEPREVEHLGPTRFDIEWWPYDPPLIDGGEIVLGTGGKLDVWPAPAGAEVQLFRSFVGQGHGPCDYPAGLCAGLLEPELHATVTADEQGMAHFELADTDYLGPMPIAWQAVVIDPVLDGVAATTEAIARHVGVPPTEAATRFEEVTARAGLTDIYTSGNTHSGGVAFVDLNNDYWPDLYISNGAGLQNYLYRNSGDGTFVNLSDRVAKSSPDIEAAGVKVADLENDGDLDLIVPVDNPTQMISFAEQSHDGGPNLLFVNQGGMAFVEQAEGSGLLDPEGRRNSAAAVADYDRDGCIDVYMVNWAMASIPAGNNPDRLLKGNCDATFTDVTATTGTDGKGRDGLVAFWWDNDFDLYPDLYIGNNSDIDVPPDFEPDDVWYRNDAGTFTEVTDQPVGEDAWAAMGIDIGDIDGDGDWDMYITDVWMMDPVPRGNALYLGEPDGTLSANACQEKGVCFGYNSWPINFEDFDNDGWVDMWVASSIPSDPDLLYINKADGTGRFDAHRQTGFDGHTSRAGTIADFDGDGDMDIFLFDEAADSSLWTNHLELRDAVDNHWIQLRLLGVQSNRAAIGAVARLTAGDLPTQMRRVSGGDSAHSHRDLTLHFGMRGASVAQQIEISWPSGKVQTFTDVAADRFYLVSEELGILEHELQGPDAFYDGTTLNVITRSNYGGRAKIEVEGLGPLTYHALDLSYRGEFALDENPGLIHLISDLGGDETVLLGP